MNQELSNIKLEDRLDIYRNIKTLHSLSHHTQSLGIDAFNYVCSFNDKFIEKYNISDSLYKEVYRVIEERPYMNERQCDFYLMNKNG